MNPATRREFLEFCQARTGALIRVGYALTGSQPAAEELAHRALARAARRWERVDDLDAYVWRALCREYLGRLRPGRRRRAVLVLRHVAGLGEQETAALLGWAPATVRRLGGTRSAKTPSANVSGGALSELAARARPVPLGPSALRRAEWRRVLDRVAAGVAAVVLLGSVVLVLPGGGGDGGPLVVEPTPSPVRPAPDLVVPPVTDPWPVFTGVRWLPSAEHTGQFAVVAYRRAGAPADAPVRLLDPATGAYRNVAQAVHAVSPDLRYAVVSREWTEPDSDGVTTVTIHEFGILDTVTGRIAGRVNLGHTSRSFRRIDEIAWAPDGRTVAFASALAIEGLGSLLDRLILLDVGTGAVRQVQLPGAGGFEPQSLLGWTGDSGGLLVAADPVGRDEQPRAHVQYDPAGHPVGVHPWLGPRQAYRLPGGDQLLLAPAFTGGTPGAEIVDVATGAVLRTLPPGPVDAALMSGEFLLLRGDELVSLDGDVLATDVRTGSARLVHRPPERAVHGLIAPAPAGLPAGAAW